MAYGLIMGAATFMAATGNLSCQHPRPLLTAAGEAAWRFDTDPLAVGWETRGSYGDGRGRFVGEWAEAGGLSDGRCLSVRKGLWQTPALPVRPLAYYRVRFAARSAVTGFYAFRFFDAAGRELGSDEHNAIDASLTWQRHEIFTQAREHAVTLRLSFISGDAARTPADALQVDEVSVFRAAERDVLAWSDRLYRTLPPLSWTPPPERWQHLAKTRERLQSGGELRVVLLGDSIANDMGNAQFQLLIQRQYRGAKIVLLRSIRGGTGCPFYRNHVQEMVADKAPDLVIIAGVSHGCDAEAIRAVIEQTRALTGRPVEFLVMTGAILEPGMNIGYKSRGIDSPPPEVRLAAVAGERAFYAKLTALGEEFGVATLDLRTLWEEYLAGCGQPLGWYQRDFVHANARGKQILGRVMEQFFAPEK